MNARIQYSINSGEMKPGIYTIEFIYYPGSTNGISKQKRLYLK